MEHIQRSILVGFLVLVLSACSVPQNETLHPEPTEPPAQETETAEPTPVPFTATPEPLPINEELIPSGFLWADPATDMVILADKNGEKLQELQIPNYSVGQIGAPLIHTSGNVSGDLDSALLFFSSRLSHVTSYDGQKLNPLFVLPTDINPDFANTVVSPGSLVMAVGVIGADSRNAFREAHFAAPTESADEATSEPLTIQSWIYAFSPEKSYVFEAALSRAEDNYVLRPLAVTHEANEMTGIWYTLQSEGVMGGGPVFFTGYRGLFYLDTTTYQSQGLLTDIKGGRLVISPDTTLVVIADFSDEDNPAINVTNLATGVLQNSIATMPNTVGFTISDTGSVHISPSNHNVAWASVIMDDSEISTAIQVTSLIDKATYRIDEQALKAKFTNQDYHSFNVVGWLDNETMLIETKYAGGVDLYSMSFDGSEIDYLVAGYFAGFVYP